MGTPVRRWERDYGGLAALSGEWGRLTRDGGGRGPGRGGSGGAAPGFVQTLGDSESEWNRRTGRGQALGDFGEARHVQGAHPVPSSCTRHKSLCSSEKQSWGSNVGYTMEALM